MNTRSGRGDDGDGPGEGPASLEERKHRLAGLALCTPCCHVSFVFFMPQKVCRYGTVWGRRGSESSGDDSDRGGGWNTVE